MRTKNGAGMTLLEAEHVAAVKSLPCSVCDEAGPSMAHHIVQGQHFTTVALCGDCHQGSHNGWHGERAIWRVLKLDELGALNVTLRRLAEARRCGS